MEGIRKPIWAWLKHKQVLAGTPFEKCAACPGTSGKLENGFMRCSRVGATAVPITAEQAVCCDGTKPSLSL